MTPKEPSKLTDKKIIQALKEELDCYKKENREVSKRLGNKEAELEEIKKFIPQPFCFHYYITCTECGTRNEFHVGMRGCIIGKTYASPNRDWIMGKIETPSIQEAQIPDGVPEDMENME